MTITNTGHVLLINNSNNDPHIFLIQESNSHWGIFGGRQESKDHNSLTKTAIRELYEESLGSLKGIPELFPYLDSYEFFNPKDNSYHKTFVVIDSRINEEDIRVDAPGDNGDFGDIRSGAFFPLYRVLDSIFSREKEMLYNKQTYKLRYFFAEIIRRNKEFLYHLFQRRNINAMEARNRLLNISPVVSTKREMVSSK